MGRPINHQCNAVYLSRKVALPLQNIDLYFYLFFDAMLGSNVWCIFEDSEVQFDCDSMMCSNCNVLYAV